MSSSSQGKCGSCWAFSSVATIESAVAIHGEPLVSLSEQFLVDCNFPQSPGGCEGGFNQEAYSFVIKNGIDTEARILISASRNLHHPSGLCAVVNRSLT